jgi:hypothetical protein
MYGMVHGAPAVRPMTGKGKKVEERGWRRFGHYEIWLLDGDWGVEVEESLVIGRDGVFVSTVKCRAQCANDSVDLPATRQAPIMEYDQVG